VPATRAEAALGSEDGRAPRRAVAASGCNNGHFAADLIFGVEIEISVLDPDEPRLVKTVNGNQFRTEVAAA
jgi:hypothetical protein